MEKVKQSLFHRGHYNIIAKRFREELAKYTDSHTLSGKIARNAIYDLALSMARRLVKDNPEFDPLMFLDNCSPDKDLYPLSEFWEDNDETA